MTKTFQSKKKMIYKEDLFNEEPRKIQMGIEVENYIARLQGKKLIPLTNNTIMNKLLDELPEMVWKDYYTYQLEIKTKPHENIKQLIREYQATFNKSVKVAYEHGLFIIPLSYTDSHNHQFNGMHVHIRNVDEEQQFYNTMINSYPIVLSVTDYLRNSPTGLNTLSARFMNSRHIGQSLIDKKAFMLGAENSEEMIRHEEDEPALATGEPTPVPRMLSTGERKFRDIIINKNIKRNFPDSLHRERCKDVDTLEIRTFDVQNDDTYFTTGLKLINKLYQYIKNDRPLMGKLWTENQYKEKLKNTREEVMGTRRAYNHFFNIPSFDVVRKTASWLDIGKIPQPYPLVNNFRDICEYEIFKDPMLLSKGYRFVTFPDKKMFGIKCKKLTLAEKRNEIIRDSKSNAVLLTNVVQSIDRAIKNISKLKPKDLTIAVLKYPKGSLIVNTIYNLPTSTCSYIIERFKTVYPDDSITYMFIRKTLSNSSDFIIAVLMSIRGSDRDVLLSIEPGFINRMWEEATSEESPHVRSATEQAIRNRRHRETSAHAGYGRVTSTNVGQVHDIVWNRLGDDDLYENQESDDEIEDDDGFSEA